ncbi:unnamed protein product [Leptidea sinapis]|uniref:HTH psq-type domain-containing protein n=1 Tax=Leptidea sinapis TaxID=189913 RepID=A0A5E4PW89_9NEOP|nr:unnamed protein product [Leptidea sinapis]
MPPKKKPAAIRCDEIEGERFHAPTEDVFRHNWWEMGRVKATIRKKGGHTAQSMNKPLELVKAGMSIRQASKECNLKYPTVRLYVHKYNVNPHVRLTPNYAFNMSFTPEVEVKIIEYIKYCAEIFYGLTTKDCRRVAYQMAKANNIKMYPKLQVETGVLLSQPAALLVQRDKLCLQLWFSPGKSFNVTWSAISMCEHRIYEGDDSDKHKQLIKKTAIFPFDQFIQFITEVDSMSSTVTDSSHTLEDIENRQG